MSYYHSITNLLASSKSFEEQTRMLDTFMVIEQMISEKVPQMVEKYVKEHTEDLIINIQTMINGAAIDLPGIKDEIMRQMSKKK